MAGSALMNSLWVLVVLIGLTTAAPAVETDFSASSRRELIECFDPEGPCRCFTNYGLIDLSPVEVGHDIPR